MSPEAAQSKRNPNRDRVILQVAADLFYERGFGNVGVDEIGERAGVTGPAIYRHFSGKDEILATLFDEALDELFAATGGRFDDPWEELRHRGVTLVDYCLQNRKLGSVLFREERSLSEQFRQRYARRESDYISGWIDCLRRCLPGKDEQELWTTANAVVGMMTSTIRWPQTVELPDDLGEQLAAVAIDGIAALA